MSIEKEEREEIEAPPAAELEGENIGADDAMRVDDDGGDLPDEAEKAKKVHMNVAADAPWSERMWEVFSTFWPLGLIAFGGPQVRYESCGIFAAHVVMDFCLS